MSRYLQLAALSLLLASCKQPEEKTVIKAPAEFPKKTEDRETEKLLDDAQTAIETAKKAEQAFLEKAQSSFYHAALYMAGKHVAPIDEAEELVKISDVYKRGKDRAKQVDVLGRSAAVLADNQLADASDLVAAELMKGIVGRLEDVPKDKIADIALALQRAAEKMEIDEAGAHALGLTHSAAAFVKAGEKNQALDMLDKEIKLIRKQKLPGLLGPLSLLYAKAGAYDKAFETIRAVDRAHGELLAGLDVLYKKMGKEVGEAEKKILSELIGGAEI